jgi:hypothetical protein
MPAATSKHPSKTSAPTSKSATSSNPAAPSVERSLPVISPEELEEFKNDPLIKKALEIF